MKLIVHVNGNIRKGNITNFNKRKKGRLGELQASQCHFCAWQDHGTDPPGKCTKAHGK